MRHIRLKWQTEEPKLEMLVLVLVLVLAACACDCRPARVLLGLACLARLDAACKWLALGCGSLIDRTVTGRGWRCLKAMKGGSGRRLQRHQGGGGVGACQCCGRRSFQVDSPLLSC